jgi:hypothetical protein
MDEPTPAELRKLLAGESGSLLEKFTQRVEAIERYRLWLVLIGAAGGLVAALSRTFPAPYDLVAAWTGGSLALVSAVLVGVFDWKKLEVGTNAKTSIAAAESALAGWERALASEAQATAAQALAEAFDERRRERLAALDIMLRTVRVGFETRAGASETAASMIRAAVRPLRRALDYDGREFLTLAIYRRAGAGATEQMVRIAADWSIPDQGEDGRMSWTRGRGYTGTLWLKAEANPAARIVLAETNSDEVRRDYPVDNADPARELLYRSIAAYPILAGAENRVWGIVIATSNRPRRFANDSAHVMRHSVELVLDIARICEIVAQIPEPDAKPAAT